MRHVVLLLCLLFAVVVRADEALLDVGVVLFDSGIPEDESLHSELNVFPRIREAEAQYLPVTLRRELEDSGQWGVVRVVPEPGPLSELTVQGLIVESNGLRQRIHFNVVDAVGRVWIDQIYSLQRAQTAVPQAGEPFAGLYRRLAADMLAFRQQLDGRSLRQIRSVALMRYAQSLSPEAFADYLTVDEQGIYRLLRLPATGDPMMKRVERIRNQEYLFIDNVDEQFGELHDEMASTYSLWLQYDQEQSLFQEGFEERAASRERHGKSGSFSAMQQTYFAYRNFRIQEQDLDDLALGFNNEVEPTIVETSGQVFKLTGTLDSQYAEWRNILRQIFAIETGLPVNTPADDGFSESAQ